MSDASGVRDLDVVVAVVTFRRPEQVAELVPALLLQLDDLAQEASRTRLTLLVVDNDPERSAHAVVERFDDPRIRVVAEPVPGVSAARNAALGAADEADLLVFIDDDERPHPGWLRHLLRTKEVTGADLVSGPVVSIHDGDLDPWVAAGGFYDREHRSGLVTGAPITHAATNNLLVDLRTVRAAGVRFDPGFGLTGGEDSLFTGTLVRDGARAVWCAEARVDDVLPTERTTPRYAVDRTVSLANAAARVRLALATSPRQRVRERATLGVKAAVRLTTGALRHGWGRLTGSERHAARGARAMARGRGEAMAVFGHAEAPYARS
ncbi:glycosyl transferase [Aeromicrobium flavum]|uniref:Glycosyl transferase n=1 Tax=Aeromicrobium flavum TaxID=416568 RepID=A0A512HWJ4_9ACTN|nr:glycosyltransferase [Aeromicrobium flavum]GEO89818.1 glycosyl transferase [Aeromicrobium flavum]